MSQVPENAEHLDALFTALGNAKRRGMLHSLATKPSTVGQLAEEQQLSLPAIHRHIRDLEAANLIQRKKVGRTNFIALKRSGLQEALSWISQYHAYWGADQETLENYIRHFKP